MAPTARLEAEQLRATMAVYRDFLAAHREVLNQLNVYPVPDGDTGTNMTLTLEAVVSELDQLAERSDMPDVCKAIAHGSLMGARGNSGVILSQLLRGVAEVLTGLDQVGACDLARSLEVASELADRAVVRPVEGTILSVARAAARAAASENDVVGGVSDTALVEVVDAARRAADDALQHTPDQLPELARAGVVDAGGYGFVLLLDALLTVLDGRPAPVPGGVGPLPASVAGPRGTGGASTTPTPGTTSRSPAAAAGHDLPAPASGDDAPHVSDLRYEVMYLLEAPDDTIPAFKEVWAGVGDSIVVVGGDGLWNCHIHTQDIGAAIEAALDCGRPRDIRVTDLYEQVEEERWVREGAEPTRAGTPGVPVPPGPPPTTAVVAVVNGDGIGRIFRSLGAFWQVTGGQTKNPSTAELVEAIENCGAEQVVVLPNNANIRAVAEQAAALTAERVRVEVVPSDSMVEGFAALLAYDPGAGVQENAAAMSESCLSVLPGEVTRAVRDADTEVGRVTAGEWIGIARQGVVAHGESLSAVVCELLGRLLSGDHELVTLIEGEGSTPADTRRVTEWLRDEWPSAGAEVHHGGQPLYPYLVGVE
jgi:uncharacterized protein